MTKPCRRCGADHNGKAALCAECIKAMKDWVSRTSDKALFKLRMSEYERPAGDQESAK